MFWTVYVELFDLILQTGMVLDDWCKVLLFHYTKVKENDVNNYRGITILSCLCKLFTRAINHWLKEFLDR